jgi:exportin-7
LAATTLTKLLSRNPCPLSIEQRLDIWNYILNYLASRPKLEPFVVQALVQLYARITKTGWFDFYKDVNVFRNVITNIRPFLQSSNSVEYCIIGIQLLSQLTCEMNQVNALEGSRSIAKLRKTAISFKECNLYEIFQLSLDLLASALEVWKNSTFQDKQQHQLVQHLLKLSLNCLSFDFIGCSPDEASDDLGTVQIPTSWRPAFMDFATLQLFFDLYRVLPTNLASISLSCLVQISSVRRSLFSNTERAQFLVHLIQGVRYILENPSSLSDTSCYHEFCRLLARLKANYQLSELVKVDIYQPTIQLITKFTVTSLQMWQFAPNSIHYLLSLWQRLVASVSYVKASEPHLLGTYAPEVTRAYITSRLEAVPVILKENLDDPLDDLGQVHQQLDQLSTICRCEYEKTCTLLVQLFDQTAQAYQERLNSMNGMQQVNNNGISIELAVQENQLTWLVYLIGSAIGGRAFLNSQEDYDAMDGELACRVLQLMQLTDNRLAQGGFCDKLELALLSFFEQFRKIYIGDQVQKSSKVFRRLSEVLGLADECTLLAVVIRKIITNLKYWNNCELIISKTLQILSDLSTGYSSVRKLVKLEEVQFILSNHTAEHFPFLGNQFPLLDMRCRSTFYTSLGRLLMIDFGEDEDKFEQFMRPICAQFDALSKMLLSDDLNKYSNQACDEAKKAIIGIARDLRGLTLAFNTKSSFMMLFECLYPINTPVLHRAIDLWYHDPTVTTPVLKLMAELVQNRSQRLQFDVSSPNGILLFRETSKMIVNYGQRILNMGDVPKDRVYQLKLKGISICFSMFRSALCGGYVNFGVFRLYGDRALDDALETFVKLVLSIPQSDLLSFPKLSQTYYNLLESLSQDHMNFLIGLDTNVFLFILSTISEGLGALDTMVNSSCCSTLDHIVTYLFKWITKSRKKGGGSESRPVGGLIGSGSSGMAVFNNQLNGMCPEVENCLKMLKVHREILQQMLSTILNIVMFEECKHQWSLSRPLLGLILLNEDYFQQLRQNIIQNQVPEKQASMAQWFDSLMDCIERNLQTKNRDR